MLRFSVGFAVLLVGFLWVVIQQPAASAQGGTDTLLDNPVCREDPYSEDCICSEVRQLALFPEKMKSDGSGIAMDTDGDTFFPTENDDGTWSDGVGEDSDYLLLAPAAREGNEGLRSELVYVRTDEYGQQCALSYFRENTRRLWVFGVSVGAIFTVISMVIIGITYMQHSASGVDLSRSRLMLIRVFIGVVILACSVLVWEGVNTFLFSNVESWTFERGTFYDFR